MPGLLSVVMPTYNGERYVGAALESLLGQRDGGVELIVVDDGSTDGTVALVEGLTRGTPTRLLRPGRLGNWVAASNLGLREARGEWCCFLHQDDLWLPGRLARLRAELPRARGDLVLHDVRFVDPAGDPLGDWTCPLPAGDVAPQAFVERLLVQNFIAIPSPAFRREAALAQGGLDERLWFSADWDLWLRLGAAGPVRFLPEVLAAFRLHPESQSASRPVGAREWAQQLDAVLDRHLPHWSGAGARRRRVESAARTSIAINATLAAVARGAEVSLLAPALSLIRLGPLGWRRYLRDSRLVERVGARLRLRRRLAGGAEVAPTSTRDAAYTARLAGLGAWWKRLLDVQRPYRNHLRSLRPGRFLEVGCGLGRNLLNARGFADGLGIDHNPTSVEVARSRGLAALTTKEFNRSPLAVPRSFDSLLFSHVLEHLPPEEALALLRAYLPFVRDGGQVIIVTPQEAGYRSDPTHVAFVDLEASARLLAEAGVTLARQESFPFPRWVGRIFTYNEFVTVGRVGHPR